MKTKLLLIGLLSLFLSACATSTELTKLRSYVDALTEPTVIEGPDKTRSDADTNGELWEFAGQAEDAVKRANDDKRRLREQVKSEEPAPKKRRWFGGKDR
jgi:hypothetical protein